MALFDRFFFNPSPEQFIIWRDSVCLGDDFDAPHECAFPLGRGTLRDVTRHFLKANYLALIGGSGATWILYAESEKRRPLAVLAQQWDQPRFLVEERANLFTYVERSAKPHLFVRYRGQVDPDNDFECLKYGKPLWDPYKTFIGD